MVDYGGRGAADVYGGVWRCMEVEEWRIGVAAIGFLNSIKGVRIFG